MEKRNITLVFLILGMVLLISCRNGHNESNTDDGRVIVFDGFSGRLDSYNSREEYRDKQDQNKKAFTDSYYEKAKKYAIDFCKNKGYAVTKIDNSGFPPNCINEKNGSFSFNIRTSDISSSGGLITISIIVEVSNGTMSIYHFQAYS